MRGISAFEDSASSEDDNHDSGGQGSQDVATSPSIDETNNNDGPTDMPLLSATRVDDSERSTTDQIYDDQERQSVSNEHTTGRNKRNSSNVIATGDGVINSQVTMIQ